MIFAIALVECPGCGVVWGCAVSVPEGEEEVGVMNCCPVCMATASTLIKRAKKNREQS